MFYKTKLVPINDGFSLFYIQCSDFADNLCTFLNIYVTEWRSSKQYFSLWLMLVLVCTIIKIFNFIEYQRLHSFKTAILPKLINIDFNVAVLCPRKDISERSHMWTGFIDPQSELAPKTIKAENKNPFVVL